MDPSASDEVGDECKESRKIHFAVQSSAPTQLDPRQVEMIRRRRPTPATLFRVADQCSPEDDQSTHQWIVGENGVLKPKRVNPNVYQPPSLKAVQKMAEAHMQNLGVYPPLEDPFEGEEYDDYPCHEEREERFPTKAAATSTTDQSEKPDEEEEEKEEEKTEEKTEEKAKKVRKSVKF
ncbi:protein phosphatase 1 regulatory subunit 1B [Salmo salar]|uniref:Protein phosphatase 1 regulatory subunit 1B n=1 Tax=Salmo salar TaxID=8030 RepID=A0A1S3R990_SALSA|nr:protein phosphatase 1 regulatory subunit 1B [Salmo salar]XP_014048315.1 protein phosphatase 1 regulatory subunit 1B [Salmo salar]|eukprot:XP_014048314.1 PREDICTED: protein phosphatase 1 regulatory subunit 1B-like [Salmo salar]